MTTLFEVKSRLEMTRNNCRLLYLVFANLDLCELGARKIHAPKRAWNLNIQSINTNIKNSQSSLSLTLLILVIWSYSVFISPFSSLIFSAFLFSICWENSSSIFWGSDCQIWTGEILILWVSNANAWNTCKNVSPRNSTPIVWMHARNPQIIVLSNSFLI